MKNIGNGVHGHGKSESQLHVEAVVPRMWELLKTSKLTTAEIAKELKISLSAIHRRCKKENYNLNERTRSLGIRKYKERTVVQTRKKASAMLVSRVDESMTGDGMSLEWLTKKW